MLQLSLQPWFTNVPNKMECLSLSNWHSIKEINLAILLLRLHPDLTEQQSSWSSQDSLRWIRHFSLTMMKKKVLELWYLGLMLQFSLQSWFTNIPNKMECWSLSNKYSMNEMKLAILLLRLHPDLTEQQSSWSFQDSSC